MSTPNTPIRLPRDARKIAADMKLSEDGFIDAIAAWVQEAIDEEPDEPSLGALMYLLRCLGIDGDALGIIAKLHEAHPDLPLTGAGGDSYNRLTESDAGLATNAASAPTHVVMRMAALARQSGKPAAQSARDGLNASFARAVLTLSPSENAICAATGVNVVAFQRTKRNRGMSHDTPNPTASLSNNELAVCAATGVNTSDFLLTKRARVQRREDARE